MSADPPSSPALRASDADRDRVIEVLRAAVAETGVDFVAVGALSHSSPALDLGLDLLPR